MIFFALIALTTAVFTLFLDRVMQKEKISKPVRWALMIFIPSLALGLYLYLGNIIFV